VAQTLVSAAPRVVTGVSGNRNADEIGNRTIRLKD
jgi:hypothetical protein